MSTLIPLIRPFNEVSFDVTCTNCVSNIKGTKPVFVDYRIDIYTPLKSKWILIDSLEFNGQNTIIIQPHLYISVGENICVGVPRHKNNPYENLTTQLPVPFSKSVDKSPVPDRYLFQASTSVAVSSFQADYPYALSKLKNSSCVSTVSPMQYNHIEKCYVIFISISADGSFQQSSTFNFVDHNGTCLTQQKTINNNSCAYLDLTNSFNNYEGTIAIPKLSGVPLFLALMRNGDDLYPSLEHSHPPHEWFWYPSKHYTRFVKNSLNKAN